MAGAGYVLDCGLAAVLANDELAGDRNSLHVKMDMPRFKDRSNVCYHITRLGGFRNRGLFTEPRDPSAKGASNFEIVASIHRISPILHAA